MIHTLLVKAIAGTQAAEGYVKLVLDNQQKDELLKDLQSLESNNSEQELAQKMRTFFFDEEGYMANDRVCQSYWWEHHD